MRTFLLGDILQPVVHRKFNTMKKLLLALFSFYGLSVASAAYVGGTDYDTDGGTVTLKDANSWATNGSFAVSFELNDTLFNLASNASDAPFNFSLTLGGKTDAGVNGSFRVDFSLSSSSFFGPLMTYSVNGSSIGPIMNLPDVSGPFVIQYDNDARDVSLLYFQNEEPVVLASVALKDGYTLPTTINVSEMSFKSGEVAMETAPVQEVVTWQGEVSAEEVANPSAVPTVPEPATATLSLLALCGLAARRRR